MNSIILKNTSYDDLIINRQKKFITLQDTVEEAPQVKIRTETVYRRDKKSIERVIEYDIKTNEKLRVLHYDFFNNERIRAIDEFMPVTGKKYRTTNYVLYKSVDEYDLESGERIRTINYDMQNENKITSIQEYDIKTKKIIKLTLYRRDGKTISTIKEINPQTDNVIRKINFNEAGEKSSVSEYNGKNDKVFKTVCYLKDSINVKEIHNYNTITGKRQQCINSNGTGSVTEFQYGNEKENIAKLIDSLYNKELCNFVQ